MLAVVGEIGDLAREAAVGVARVFILERQAEGVGGGLEPSAERFRQREIEQRIGRRRGGVVRGGLGRFSAAQRSRREIGNADHHVARIGRDRVVGRDVAASEDRHE